MKCSDIASNLDFDYFAVNLERLIATASSMHMIQKALYFAAAVLLYPAMFIGLVMLLVGYGKIETLTTVNFVAY